MKKILEYILSIVCWVKMSACFAAEKFEVLPDLPDPLAAYAQTAEASTVSGGADTASLLGGQSIGHEPSIVSVVFSLLFVILLIYLTQILYTKLKKANINILKTQQGNLARLQASVISTTALGSNKTLHVIELDGKRMLIGASSGAIQLIKDLGNVTEDGTEEDFSHIEIPTIKIPRIEIPKIEIPTIGFSKLATKIHKDIEVASKDSETETEGSEEYSHTDNPEGIIDSLFTKPQETLKDEPEVEETVSEHIVDPDDFALYKKYL